MTEFIFPLSIYIEDTDYGGVVYHANYLKYFERARSVWAEQLGLGFAWQTAEKIFFAVRSAELDYLLPARLGLTVEVVSKIVRVGRASLSYEQYLRLTQEPYSILCNAKVKVACINHQFELCPLPSLILKRLEASQ